MPEFHLIRRARGGLDAEGFMRSLRALPAMPGLQFFAWVDRQAAPALADALSADADGLAPLPWPHAGEPAWKRIFGRLADASTFSIFASVLEAPDIALHLRKTATALWPDDPWELLDGWRVDVLRAALLSSGGAPAVFLPAQRDRLLAACVVWWFEGEDRELHMCASGAARVDGPAAPVIDAAQSAVLLDACQPRRLANAWRREGVDWVQGISDEALLRHIDEHWREAHDLRLLDVRPVQDHIARALRHAHLLQRSAAIRELMLRVRDGRLGIAQAMKRIPGRDARRALR